MPSASAKHFRSVLGETADDLREVVRDFVRERSPEPHTRLLAASSDGFDPEVWKQIGLLELHGITVPESYGGLGLGQDVQAVVFEEMGSALMCAPYLSNSVAAHALVAIGDDAACADLLPGLLAGSSRGTIAVIEADGRWKAESIRTTATRRAGGMARLNGEKVFVLDGHTADILVVAALTGDALSLYAVDAHGEGVKATPIKTFDGTRKQARVVFSGAEGRLLGEPGAGWAVLERILSYGSVAVAAEQVGGTRACLEMTVQYAKDRIQFGRPIGTFQAVKHACAEMLRLTELAQAAAYEAAIASARSEPHAALSASVAKASCSEAFSWVASECIHLHGGIGYTWEHPAHLYFRRAKSSEQLFGSPAEHRERVLDLLGIWPTKNASAADQEV